MNYTPQQRILLAIVLISYLMGVLDVSIVITALPKMQQSFGAAASTMSWVQSTYTLAFGGLLLLGARAGDILGRKRMYMIGLTIFTVSSVVIGSAQSLPLLLVARAIQGIGAAILSPTTLALLQTSFPEGPARTKAVSYYGAAAGIGGSIGLMLGGLFADSLSWRMGFFINLPIGLILFLAARKYIAETERRQGHFDLAGSITSTLGMTALVFGIVHSSKAGWGDGTTLASIVVGISLLVGFLVNESNAKQPIMPLRLFESRERVGAYAARMLFLGGMMGFWFFMSQFMQSVLGFSALKAAIAFFPMTLVSFPVAMAVPSLTKRFGNARILAFGLTLTVIGMAWLSRLSETVPYVTGIALPMILLGIGQGSSLGPMMVAGVAGVEPEDAGAAAGAVSVSQQLGSSLGLAILVALYTSVQTGTDSAKLVLAHRISETLVGSTVMLGIALALTVILILRPQLSVVTPEKPAVLEAA